MKKIIYGLLLSVSLTAITHGEAKDDYKAARDEIKRVIKDFKDTSEKEGKKGLLNKLKKHDNVDTTSSSTDFKEDVKKLLNELKPVYLKLNGQLMSQKTAIKYLKKLEKTLEENDIEDFVKYYNKLSEIAGISPSRAMAQPTASSIATQTAGNVSTASANVQPHEDIKTGSAVPPPPGNVPPPPTNIPAPNAVKTGGSVVPPPPGNVPPPPMIAAKAPASTKINVPAKKTVQASETLQDQIAKGVKLKPVANAKTAENKKVAQPANPMNLADLAVAGRGKLRKTNSKKDTTVGKEQPVETEFQRRARERAERAAKNQAISH